MLYTTTNKQETHFQFISIISHLRQEWQEATDGVSLLKTDGNIGLILVDLINGFELNDEDQCQILGTELFHELRDFLSAPKQI